MYLEAVGAVVGGEEGVDKEDLRHGIGEVQQLGGDVQRQQVVALSLTTHQPTPAATVTFYL